MSRSRDRSDQNTVFTAPENFELLPEEDQSKRPKKRDDSKPVQQDIFSDVMPNISAAMLEIPNIFVLSNLFPVSMHRKKNDGKVKYFNNTELDSIKGIGRLKYTGPQLTRDHEDVLLAIIRKVQLNQLSIMSPVRVTIYELLEELEKSTGSKNYQTIINVIRDLDQVSLEISDERILSNLVELWKNRESTHPRMQRFLEGHTELIKIMAEDFQEGNRYLTVKFIRNIIGEMGKGERFGIELDPYTVLMYGNSSTIRVPSQARKEYQEKLTYKLVPMIRWQAYGFLDWTEATWQKLILPKEEQMSFDRKDRNRRAAFRRNFEAALAEAEAWGEILPNWEMEERFIKREGTRGKGHKSFITRNICRLSSELRVLLVKAKLYNGFPEYVLFCYLQSIYMKIDSSRVDLTVNVSLDQLITLFMKAPFGHEGQPATASDSQWMPYLSERISMLKSLDLLPPETDFTCEYVNGSERFLLSVNLSDVRTFKSLKKKMLIEQQASVTDVD